MSEAIKRSRINYNMFYEPSTSLLFFYIYIITIRNVKCIARKKNDVSYFLMPLSNLQIQILYLDKLNSEFTIFKFPKF